MINRKKFQVVNSSDCLLTNLHLICKECKGGKNNIK